MIGTAILSTLVTESTSDGFGIVLYDTTSPSWETAARLISGETIASSSRLFLTSADGLTRSEISRDDFCAQLHAEPVLTMSSDWVLDGLIDGYVQGTCRYEGQMAIELYQYGTLDRFEASFLDLLFGRFVDLVRSCGHGLLAIDACGESGEDEWRRVYNGSGAIPETASVVAAPIGAYRGPLVKLSRAFEEHGIEVFVTLK